MHPQVEFLIMEAVLEQPENTLAEIAHEVYVQTGSQYTLNRRFFLLEEKPFQFEKGKP